MDNLEQVMRTLKEISTQQNIKEITLNWETIALNNYQSWANGNIIVRPNIKVVFKD